MLLDELRPCISKSGSEMDSVCDPFPCGGSGVYLRAQHVFEFEWCSFRLCHFDFRTLAFIVLSSFTWSSLSHFFYSLRISWAVLFSMLSTKFGRSRTRREKKTHRDFCRWINFSWSVATYNLQHWHIDDDILNEINWPKHFLLLHFLPFFCKKRARTNSNDEYTESKRERF